MVEFDANVLLYFKKHVTLIDMSKIIGSPTAMLCMSCMSMMMDMCRVTLNTGRGEVTLN